MMKVEYIVFGMVMVYFYQSDSEYFVDFFNWVCLCQDFCDDCCYLFWVVMEFDFDEMSVFFMNDFNEFNFGDEDGEFQIDGGECDCLCCMSDIGFFCFDVY